MKSQTRILLSALTVSIFAACGTQPAKQTTAEVRADQAAAAKPAFPKTLAEAVNGNFRTPANKLRDPYRHPEQTLAFFGVKPDMTVVEISPSGGWYTEILAPYLAANGHYVAADRMATDDESKEHADKIAEWMRNYPDVAAHMQAAQFDPPKKIDFAPDNSADMVLTFRNVHNWLGKHSEAKVFKAFFKALKPGGTLGVVEHRAKDKGSSAKGYMKTADVIKLAQKAGFKLVAKSEINANLKDTKDYPEGVWTLPPSFALGAQDHDKYAAIGESDRMTLKFEKPSGKAK